MEFNVPGPQPNPEINVPFPSPPQGLPPHLHHGLDKREEPGRAPTPGKKTGLWAAVLGVVLVGALGWWALGPGPNPALDGDRHPRDEVIQLVNDKSKPGDEWLGHVARDGTHQLVRAVLISDEDRDPKTTAAVKQALQTNDLNALQAVVQAAQQIPEVKDPLDKGPDPKPLPIQLPKVTPELRDKTMADEFEFVRLFLFDSCAEDGDVVEVQVNGVPFAVVPLTHRGATVSIPVSKSGGTKVTIRGVRDGEGGGITLGARTSRGSFFFRNMRENEILPLGNLRF